MTNLATDKTRSRHCCLFQLWRHRRCLLDSTSRDAFSFFYNDKGRVLSEEEHAKENVYIKKKERKRLEKQKQQVEKEKFEDFANHNAFDLLAKYSLSHLVFNDDIRVANVNAVAYFNLRLLNDQYSLVYFQGTKSVVLVGLLASLKLVRRTLADHTFLLLGAEEAGTGIAELIALEISKQMLKLKDEPRLRCSA
ncbi:NADP-dependent malic enzyme [Arachis hypogaea]|nr:NADP-dependent malic enzyme [Arachis hypogaea]